MQYVCGGGLLYIYKREIIMRLTLRAQALTKKLTLITTAFILAVSTLTAAVPFILSQKASAVGTSVITPASPAGWVGADDNGNGGSLSFVAGPSTAPLGAGSAQLSTTTSNQGYLLAKSAYGGLKLTHITALSYETYIQQGNNTIAPSLQFNIVANAATDTNWQGRLVYEPYYNGTVTDGTWQSHNALTGKWWFSKPASFGNNCAQSSPCTFSQILALYPDAGVSQAQPLVAFKAGSGWTTPFIGNIDNFIINDDTYNFEPTPPDTQRPAVSFVNPSTDGQAFKGNLNVQFQASDNDLLKGITVNIKDQFNSANLGTCGTVNNLNVASYTLNCTIDTTNFTDGTYYLRGNATDVSNNNKTVSTKVIFDNKRPTNTITFPLASSSQPSNFTITGKATDATSGIDHVHVWVTKYNADGSFGSYIVSEDVNVDGSGNYQLPVTLPYNAGPYGYRVHSAAYDLAGNAQNTEQRPVYVDNQAPAAPTLTFPANAVVRKTANANHSDWSTVTDPEGNGPVTYIYQSAFDTDFNSIAYTSLPLTATTINNPGEPGGTYYWHVKACDSLGNCSAWSAYRSIIIDNTTPVVTVTPVAGSLLHGTVTFDITVTDANLNPSAPSTWVYLYNNAPPQASKGASVNLSSGHGTFTVDTTLLADGLSSLDVGKLYDAAGNASGVGDTYFKNYKIDNTAPVITVNNLFTIDSTPVLSGHVDDTAATVVVKIGSHAYPVVVDTSTGDWTAQVSPTLSDGHYNVVAKATDLAGNVGNDTTTNELTVDAHIPGAPLMLLPVANGYSNNANTLFTWIGPFFVTHSPATFNLQVATDSSFTNIVVYQTGSSTNPQTHNLADGVYYTRISSTDSYGGTGAWSSTRKFTVDTVNPVVAISAPSDSDVVHDTVNIEGNATDLHTTGYRWTIKNSSNNTVHTHASLGSTVNSYAWDTTGVPDGEYTIYLRATDAAFNSKETSVTVTVDNTAPDAPVLGITGLTSGQTTNQSSVTAIWNKPNADVVKYEYKYWNEISTSPWNASNPWTVEVTGESRLGDFTEGEGKHFIQVRAFDAVGHASLWSNIFEVNYDNTAPVISFTAASYNFTGVPTVEGSTDDPSATLNLIVNGGTPIDVTGSILSGAWLYHFGSSIPSGTYNLELVAVDPAGNSSSASASLVIAEAATPTTFTTNPPVQQTATITPTTGGTPTPAAQGVLGDSTTTNDNSAVAGDSTNKEVAVANTTDASDGTIFGLAWYWWLLIVAAAAAIVWWIAGAIRNRQENE